MNTERDKTRIIGRKETINLSLIMSAAGVAGKLLSIPKSIVVASLLNPVGYGILQLFRVLISYMSYSQLGLLQGMNRNIPKAYANNDLRLVQQIKNLTLSWLISVTFLVIFALWIAFLFGYDFKGQLTLERILLLTLIAITSKVNAFIRPLLKAEGNFGILGRASLISNIISPIVAIIAVIYLGLTGAIFGLLFTQVLTSVIYLSRYRDIKFQPYFNIKLFKSQLRVGFVIFLSRYAENMITSISILLVGYYYTPEQVGVFSFGMLSLTGITTKFASPLNIIMYRNIMVTKDSANRNSDYYKRMLNVPYSLHLFLNTFLLGLFTLAYYALIINYLQKYEGSIIIMYIVLFGLTIYSSRTFLSHYFDATDQLRFRLYLILIGALIGLVLVFLFLYTNSTLSHVAFACSVGFACIGCLIIYLAIKQILNSSIKPFLYLIRLISIAIFNTYFIFILNDWSIINISLEGNRIFGALQVLADFGMKLLFYLIFNITLFSLVFSHLKLFREIRNVLVLLLGILKKTAGIREKT